MPHCWLATASAASAFFWLSEGVKRPGRDGDTFSDAAAQLGVGLPQEDADFFREFCYHGSYPMANRHFLGV